VSLGRLADERQQSEPRDVNTLTTTARRQRDVTVPIAVANSLEDHAACLASVDERPVGRPDPPAG
jgi:hypothetical protein